MTAIEIIEETAKHYNLLNRAEGENGSCNYLQEGTGFMCAVGRCMRAEALEEYGDFNGDVDSLTTDMIELLDHYLKDEYKGHHKGFWFDLQLFHDCSEYWSIKGLSEEGEDMKNDLIKRYGKS